MSTTDPGDVALEHLRAASDELERSNLATGRASRAPADMSARVFPIQEIAERLGEHVRDLQRDVGDMDAEAAADGSVLAVDGLAGHDPATTRRYLEENLNDVAELLARVAGLMREAHTYSARLYHEPITERTQ